MIKAKADKRDSPIVDLMQVLSRFNAENGRSNSAKNTGKVHKICIKTKRVYFKPIKNIC